jgi:hypothetical protein
MKKILSILGGIMLVFVFVTTAKASNLLINGGFEAPEVSGWGVFPDGYTDLGWTVSLYDSAWYNPSRGAPPYELEIQRNLYGIAAEGSQYAELDSYGSTLITQPVSTTPGYKYRLSYSWSPRPDAPDNGLAVYINGVEVLSLAVGPVSGSFAWTPVTYGFTATSDTTTIGFAETETSDQLGMFLDNVSLELEQMLPTNKDQCKKDGWKVFGVFKNQGDCVSFVATGGKNLPANLPVN